MGDTLRSNRFWITLLCGVLLISIVIAFLMQRTSSSVAIIYYEGKLLERVDLAAVTKPYNITVDSGDDGYNIISIERGRICVSEADCSDKSCVRQGWVSGGIVPIVCLPHRLVIRMEDSKTPEFDAVVG